MDRATIRNIFFPNNNQSGNTGGVMMNNQALQGNMDMMGSQGDSDSARALEIAGYPSLLQEFLFQQQQQEQAAAAASAAALESRMAFTQAFQQQNQWGGGGLGGASNNSFLQGQGMNFGMPSSLGADVSSFNQQQQLDSNQLLFDRLQGANAGLPRNVWGNPNDGNGASSADKFAENGILGPWSERSAGLLGSMVATSSVNKPTKVKKGRRKQPKNKPKRPLSAYNIFFKEERARLLQKLDDAKTADKPSEEDDAESADKEKEKKTPSKIGFESLAKIIGSKWQDLTPSQVQYYKGKAAEDMKRYKGEMEVFNANQSGKDAKTGENQEDDTKKFVDDEAN